MEVTESESKGNGFLVTTGPSSRQKHQNQNHIRPKIYPINKNTSNNKQLVDSDKTIYEQSLVDSDKTLMTTYSREDSGNKPQNVTSVIHQNLPHKIDLMKKPKEPQRPNPPPMPEIPILQQTVNNAAKNAARKKISLQSSVQNFG